MVPLARGGRRYPPERSLSHSPVPAECTPVPGKEALAARVRWAEEALTTQTYRTDCTVVDVMGMPQVCAVVTSGW